MNVGAVIAAADRPLGTDDGGQIVKIGNLTLAERIVINFQRAGIKDIAVITGASAKQVEKSLHRFGVTFLKKENYESSELFDSARMGLEYLKNRCDQVFFCPVDIPFFTEQTLRSLLEQPGEIVIPKYNGRRGHPVRFDAGLIPSILKYQGDRGLKGALDSLGIAAYEVPVDDEGVVVDADEPRNYQHILKLHDEKLMRPQVKVRLANHRPFFGPGAVTLLRQIDRLESVREACGKMGISYSKGWTIIRTAEEELGYKIVERRHGGKNGGAAYVTERGKKLLYKFERYEEQVEKAALELFEDIFLGTDLF